MTMVAIYRQPSAEFLDGSRANSFSTSVATLILDWLSLPAQITNWHRISTEGRMKHHWVEAKLVDCGLTPLSVSVCLVPAGVMTVL